MHFEEIIVSINRDEDYPDQFDIIDHIIAEESGMNSRKT